MALHLYHGHYKSFPTAYTTGENGTPLHSWRVLLLPFLDQNELYKSICLDEPWDSEHNMQFHSQMPRVYECPLSVTQITRDKGLTSYQWVVGPNTISDGSKTTTFDDVTVDIHNVVCLVEVIPTTCWMAPIDIQENSLAGNFSFSRDFGVGSKHVGGMVIGMLDGSVQFMPNREALQLKDRVKIKPVLSN